VNKILIQNNTIWAATEKGVAYADLNNTNLMDPDNWLNITASDGLPDNEVNALVAHNQTVFIGTEQGIVRIENETLSIIQTQTVYDLVIHSDTLYAALDTGIFQWRDETDWLKIGDSAYKIQTLTSAFSKLWGGAEEGLYSYSNSGTIWNHYLPNCIGSNLISDITVDKNGDLWCCSRDRGFFHFDEIDWTVYDRSSLEDIRFNDFYSILVDEMNNKWVGSWGDGIVRIDNDNAVQYFNAQNGFLAGITVDPDYAVVSDMTVDQSGNVWILNREAVNNMSLISVSNDNQWTYYGIQEGIGSKYVTVIAVDQEGRKWIGTNIPNAQGIYILNDNGTPSNKNDDPPVVQLKGQVLESDEITALAGDREGGMWIGTPDGLYYYFYGTLSRKYGLPSENVTSLAVDGINNVWVGTNVGVCTFSNENYTWIQYTMENSPLVSNDVTSLYLDLISGTLFIATSEGVSSLQTPYSEPKSDLSHLRFYPNPFLPKEHGALIIDNLAEDCSIYIYTSSGHIVRRFTLSDTYGRQISWNGMNDSGNPVSGGIYLVVASTVDGESRTGKIVLIR